MVINHCNNRINSPSLCNKIVKMGMKGDLMRSTAIGQRMLRDTIQKSLKIINFSTINSKRINPQILVTMITKINKHLDVTTQQIITIITKLQKTHMVMKS